MGGPRRWRSATALLFAAAALPAAADPYLRTAPQLPLSRLSWGPYVLVADFNGDGRRDAAYSLTLPTGVAVALGDGAGGFGVPIVTQLPTQVVSNASGLAGGDFNGDGVLDLAVSDFASGPSVYLGLGDGRFAARNLGGDLWNSGLAIADFDGDGKADLALARRPPAVAEVLFYRGDGAGDFAPPLSWTLPAVVYPKEVVAADFNGDGKADLALADDLGDAVVVLLGNATLTPNVRGPFPAGDGAAALRAGDLNGDGRLDLVVAARGQNAVSVLLGDGLGSFGPPTTLPGPLAASEIELGDFDGDGRLDLAVSGWGMWTYRGDGAGGFAAPRRYGLTGDIAAGQLDGDGRLDLVVGDSMLAGDGAGGFAAQRSYAAGTAPRLAVAADFDRDGHADVAVTNDGGAVSVLRGDGAGGFGPPTTRLTGTEPTDIATADFDRDGWPDLAISHAGTRDVVVLRNDHAGGFTLQSYPITGVPRAIAVDDWTGDQLPDVAVANETTATVDVLRSAGGGALVGGASSPAGPGPLALAAGRFNADPRSDLLFSNAPPTSSPAMQLMTGTGGGTFVGGEPLGVWSAQRGVVAADLDADGRLDLAAAGDSQPFPQVGGLAVRLGDGQGGFSPPVLQPPAPLSALVAGDFTQDGRLDLAVLDNTGFFAEGLHLMVGAGDGRFGRTDAAAIPLGGRASSLCTADFDGDGRPDVAVAVNNADLVTVLRARPPAGGTDLAVSIVDTPDPVQAGTLLRYTVTAQNRGPLAARAVQVRFQVPPGVPLQAASPGPPLCSVAGGLVTCLLDTLAAGASFVLTVDTMPPAASGGQPVAWADVEALQPDELAPADNFVTERTSISPVDLSVAIVDSDDPVLPGQQFRYTVTITNHGAWPATGVRAATPVPAGISLVETPCSAPGSTVICGVATMLPGQSASFDIDVRAGLFTSVVLTSTVTADQADAQPADNTASQETRMVLDLAGELLHGAALRRTLKPATPAQETFLVRVPARSSFEVVVDEASGDFTGGGLPLSLERLASDTTTPLQVGVATGAGPSRALRWQNTAASTATQLVRVRSRGCTRDCGPDDTYRVRAWDTTAVLARFNTAGPQETVVIVHNPGASVANGTLWFWDPSGTLLASPTFLLGPRQSYVLNVATLLPGRSGSITISHDAGYGALDGKAVALEPANGFSFDTVLESRPR